MHEKETADKVTGSEKLLYIIFFVYGHNARSRLTVRRMEGHREGELQVQPRQIINARHYAAGG